jgi:hypothetical protein
VLIGSSLEAFSVFPRELFFVYNFISTFNSIGGLKITQHATRNTKKTSGRKKEQVRVNHDSDRIII